jgi:hypothetical protein
MAARFGFSAATPLCNMADEHAMSTKPTSPRARMGLDIIGLENVAKNRDIMQPISDVAEGKGFKKLHRPSMSVPDHLGKIGNLRSLKTIFSDPNSVLSISLKPGSDRRYS